MMDIRSWPRTDREEYLAIVNAAWTCSDKQVERLDKFIALIADAEQAQRPWVSIVRTESERIGMGSLLKAQPKIRSVIPISHNGKLLRKPSMIGAKRRTAEGEQFFSQTLFDYMTVDELREKRAEYLREQVAYGENVAIIDRLLDLIRLVEGASTPAEAAKALGTSVAEWLAKPA